MRRSLSPDPHPAGASGDALLHRLLGRARDLGFLGAAPIAEQIAHSRALVGAVGANDRVLDLGSGGGLPGLVVAADQPSATVVLLDAMSRRTVVLADAAEELNAVGTHLTVITARAEEAGRDPEMRGRFDLVLARSFGPPAVVAECAAPFLRRGGRLVVSEPPGGRPDRWPAAELRKFGLVAAAVDSQPVARVVLVAEEPCPDRYPRRVGVPARRPLFHVEHDD